MEDIKNGRIQSKLLEIITRDKFLYDVKEDTISIEEKHEGSKLKEVIIKDTPHDEEGVIIWRFDLEKKVSGLSPLQQKTVETAFAFFKDSVLKIYLIELKSSIREMSNKSTLNEIKGKIEDSISRLYFLIFFMLNDFEKMNKVSFNEVDIEKFRQSRTKFKGYNFL